MFQILFTLHDDSLSIFEIIVDVKQTEGND